jgi:hypothetical protein
MTARCGMTVPFAMHDLVARNEATARNAVLDPTAMFAMIGPFGLNVPNVEIAPSAPVMTGMTGMTVPLVPLAMTVRPAMIVDHSYAVSARASIT